MTVVITPVEMERERDNSPHRTRRCVPVRGRSTRSPSARRPRIMPQQCHPANATRQVRERSRNAGTEMGAYGPPRAQRCEPPHQNWRRRWESNPCTGLCRLVTLMASCLLKGHDSRSESAVAAWARREATGRHGHSRSFAVTCCRPIGDARSRVSRRDQIGRSGRLRHVVATELVRSRRGALRTRLCSAVVARGHPVRWLARVDPARTRTDSLAPDCVVALGARATRGRLRRRRRVALHVGLDIQG